MKTSLHLKFAASALILGVTTIGCTPNRSGLASASSVPARAQQHAGDYIAKAEAAARQKDFATALVNTEDAVAASPSDVGYRMMLADLYVKNGRFASAQTSYADVLTLNPGNPRATLNLALVEIAQGRTEDARALLDGIAATAPAADVGLAYALAGQPQRAVAMLEAAARAPGADGRTRQNLALAYALCGDWKKARSTAAQDVSPADLEQRMTQWAALAHPASQASQVATILGVTPAADQGQPVRLALAPPASPDVQTAAVEAPKVADTAPPVETAQADPAPTIAPVPVPVQAAQPSYADAVNSLVESPAVIRASATAYREPVSAVAAIERAARPQAHASRFVVQLGAYRTAPQVEKAWASKYRKFRFASTSVPLSTTVSLPGHGVFHRLSVSGFGSHDEAARLCGAIRSSGGECFVRATAGDAPVRWASRYVRHG